MNLKTQELHSLLTDKPFSAEKLFPEAARNRLEAATASPTGRRIFTGLERNIAKIEEVEPLTRSLYQDFFRTGNRKRFEAVYFLRRGRLSAAALSVAGRRKPKPEVVEILHDWLWAICEESTWVLPAHTGKDFIELDLFASMTGMMLAEISHLLGERLAPEVRKRVQAELERRIITPYLRHGTKQWWYRGRSNWNGVCNGAVGATLLYAEQNPRRLEKGLAQVLRGLERYFRGAFTTDGASTEGLDYWQFGLSNVVMFSELLRNRTSGRFDLLNNKRLRAIAAYPLNVLLTAGGRFYPYADCPRNTSLSPGLTARLAERTGVEALKRLIIKPAAPAGKRRDSAAKTANKKRGATWFLPYLLRNLLWWDGKYLAAPKITDTILPKTGVGRLVAPAAAGKGKTFAENPPVVAFKAGHNQELHNHNDIGSFTVAAGETVFICDAGAGVYTRETFSKQRYNDRFIGSYGHDVPLLAGKEQGTGAKFSGKILKWSPGSGKPAKDGAAEVKSATMEIAPAYGLKELRSLKRTLTLPPFDADGGWRFLLEDEYFFSGSGLPVEEALTTWLPVVVRGKVAVVRGEKEELLLRIVAPGKMSWRTEKLVRDGRAGVSETLRRLFCRLPRGKETLFSVEGTFRPRR